MSKWRKRPVVVDAIQFTGNNLMEVAALAGWECDRHEATDELIIETLEGDMRCKVSDWVIRGVAGEVYPCREDIFYATYEPAEEG